MMKGLQFDRIVQTVGDMSHGRLMNYIVPGVSSDLVGDGGTLRGKVRVFRAEREARDFVTPHSHRFNFCGIVLKGGVANTLFQEAVFIGDGDEWCKSLIDQVCGADGLNDYTHTRAFEPTKWTQHTESYRRGDSYFMEHDEIHSIVFEKGTEVLILEGPELTRTSTMLEPWVNGKCVPTFRTEPWMFER